MQRANAKRRPRDARVVAAIVPPVVAAVVQPVAKRLARIEALLIEIRFEHDVQARRIKAIHEQLEVLTEKRRSTRQRPKPNSRAQSANGTSRARLE
jgi:hypothetical protein